MSDRIIFLDFDGPLMNTRVHAAYGDSGVWGRPDPVGIQFLNRLTDRTGALLVLSTSWRLMNNTPAHDAGFSDLRLWLASHGLTGSWHDDYKTTYDYHFHTRAEEISQWLNRHPDVIHWVAIDDANMRRQFKGRSIVCDEHNGISHKNYHQALSILQNQNATIS